MSHTVMGDENFSTITHHPLLYFAPGSSGLGVLI